MIRSKYHARKTEVDGEVFDSAAEARRWQELNLLVFAGEIHSLLRQVPFVLVPRRVVGTGRTRRVLRAVVYNADFAYQEAHGRLVVEDVKGVRTPVFQIKARLFADVYPGIELRIVK